VPSDGLGPLPNAPLRLTVARGALGLELYEPIELGPVVVESFGVTLPNLKFPVDLSGGVRLFRHRRGHLEHLSVSLRVDLLGRWLERRLRETLGGLIRPVSVWRVESGLGVGIVGARGAIAFDVLFAPSEGDVRLVVARARGAEVEGSALGVALQIVDTSVGRFMKRRGRVATLTRAGSSLARIVMPAVGARAPSSEGVRCGTLEGEGDVVRVALDRGFAPAPLSNDVVRALELAELTHEADDALAHGDPERARAHYVAALERAPRHPEVTRLVAEIDAHHGGRAEGALSMLNEALPVTETGIIGATLLARRGDLDGAREALRAATRAEEYAPLAALLFRRQATYETTLGARLQALDEAVARCPALPSVRWSRFEARLERGDVDGAVSDAEHLEATESGNRARHDVCLDAAKRTLGAGYQKESGRLFERALRYLPDDPEATAGLARTLIEAGRPARALALLERAITLGEKKGTREIGATMDLAKLLAKMGDLPQAIARVRQVPASPRAVEARALEGDWRASLGDLSGATLAYGRMRESLEVGEPGDPSAAVEWLRSAARFEGDVQKDPSGAERHLALAVRLAPRDRGVLDAYREVATVVAARNRRQTESEG